MYAGTVKHTGTCVEISRLADLLRHTIRIATAGRPGPAHLIIPVNLLHQNLDYTPLDPCQYRLLEQKTCDTDSLAQIAGEIVRARFPVLMAGERCLLPDASAELQALSERFHIPVVTDLSCKSAIDEWSPMFMGCLGVLAHKAGEQYLKERSDLVVSIGQTFNEISTLSWDPAIANGRKLVQLDTDPEEIGKVYPVRLASAGHLPTMLSVLSGELAAQGMSPTPERDELIARLQQRFPLFQLSEMFSEKVPLLPQRIVHEIREALPEDALLLSDSSKWTRWLGRCFQARRRTFVTAHDYEPMGWAVAGVIGAKVAFPDRPVVCVSGDGAFLTSAMELSTAANHKLDIIWLVMNDSRLGIIYDMQRGLYGGVSSTTFANPDYASFAAAFGITSQRIERPGELADGLRAALSRGGSALFNIVFDPDEIPPVRPRSLLITKGMGLPNPKPSPEVTRAMIKLLKER